MATHVPLHVHLKAFEGPLDLLLYLIQSHELDISKVSISKITDQYLAYVRLMQELDFDTASEFLVLAATLLHWKSRALLPQEIKAEGANSVDDVILSQDDLVLQLLLHQRFLAAGETLSQLSLLGEDVFARANKKPPLEKIWKEMDMTDLSVAYQDMIVRARKRTQVLKKETVSIHDKMIELADRLNFNQLVELRSLLSTFAVRGEVVALFLATLELARLKKLKVYQEKVYSSIFLELIEKIQNLDIQLAAGFTYESATQ